MRRSQRGSGTRAMNAKITVPRMPPKLSNTPLVMHARADTVTVDEHGTGAAKWRRG